MKKRFIISGIGAAILIVLCVIYDIGTVANYIQVASAIPWFYALWRIEELHRKHDRRHHNESRHNDSSR